MQGEEIAQIVAVAFLGVFAIGKWIFHPMLNNLIAYRRDLAGIGTPDQEKERKTIEHLESEIQVLKDRINEQEILLDDRRYLGSPDDAPKNTLSG